MSREQADAGRVDFDQLFEEFSAPIYNYVLRMVSDPDRAADITQDTFIKAYRKLDTVTDAASTRSWLYRIATNTAIDDMRRRRNVTTMPDDSAHLRQPRRCAPRARGRGDGLDTRRARAARAPDPAARTIASACCSVISRT